MAHIQTFILSNPVLFEIQRTNKVKTGRSTRRGANISSSHAMKPSLLMQTIQVLCAPSLLSFEPTRETVNFPTSQSIVYSTAAQHPIFHGCHGLDVNMDFVLHNINFWKYHMLREAEGTLYYAFSELEDDERPRWWDNGLQQGVKTLGRHWKGSYAFVNRGEEIETLREGGSADEHVQDVFAGEGYANRFQDMDFRVPEDDEEFPWPEIFERHLHSLSLPASRAKTRAQRRSGAPEAIENLRPQSFQFTGDGQDIEEVFNAAGWLNPLPPQSGVPGWQRMTMMKYFEDEDGTLDTGGLWAYEGVVLPGGQIILGRWWCPMDDAEEMYSGPFILWCVDGPRYAEPEGEDADKGQ